MADVMERIAAHFASLGRRRIEVPEWGADGAPLVIECTPMTVADKSEIYRYAKGSLDWMVRLIVLKAEDGAGHPMFGKDAIHKLTHYADGRVIERIANAILEHGAPDGNELGN